MEFINNLRIDPEFEHQNQDRQSDFEDRFPKREDNDFSLLAEATFDENQFKKFLSRVDDVIDDDTKEYGKIIQRANLQKAKKR